MDVFDSLKRSLVMSQIRARRNKNTELQLIKILRDLHLIGWRRDRPIFGKPDFIFQKQRIAIFVDGCFWHGCPKHFRYPATNEEFWRKKLDGNFARDRLVNETLERKGYRVLRFWECEIERKRNNTVIPRLLDALNVEPPIA